MVVYQTVEQSQVASAAPVDIRPLALWKAAWLWRAWLCWLATTPDAIAAATARRPAFMVGGWAKGGALVV